MSTESPRRPSPLTCGVLALAALGLIAVMVWSGSQSPPASAPSSEPTAETRTAAVWVQCKRFVTDALKVPATADFPFFPVESITSLGSGRFRVQSYVDAENSFGAKIRTNFTCDVRQSGSTWVLESLKTDP